MVVDFLKNVTILIWHVSCRYSCWFIIQTDIFSKYVLLIKQLQKKEKKMKKYTLNLFFKMVIFALLPLVIGVQVPKCFCKPNPCEGDFFIGREQDVRKVAGCTEITGNLIVQDTSLTNLSGL